MNYELFCTFAPNLIKNVFMIEKCRAFLEKPFFHDFRTLLGLWLLLPLIATLVMALASA